MQPVGAMQRIPKRRALDESRALLRDPYRFIQKRCRELGTDLFQTRLLLRPTICLSGPAAAELFYDTERFQRRGAAPEPLRATLFGKGGVQTLDGAAHRHRKALFLGIARPSRVRELAVAFAREWESAAARWCVSREPLVLYDAVRELLTRAVVAWAGVPLREREVEMRTRQLSSLFDEVADPGHLRARARRKLAERWATRLVRDVRAGRLSPPPDSALYAIAFHRDENEEQLRPGIAAVELLNVLRPTIAVAVYVTQLAHALELHPASRDAIARGDAGYAECFVEEVRRAYPFFPAVAAKTRRRFEWSGFRFPKGRRVMLDLYGTDHDPRAWDAPEAFRPERFQAKAPGPFELVPQGGGEPRANHRCPGEGIVVELMKVAVDQLVNRMCYRVPPQDLAIDMQRLPALPRDGFVIETVRLVA